MNKALALISTAAMVGVTSLSAIVPAAAAPMNRQQYVMNWCQQHPRDSSCRDFSRNHHRWSDSQYRNWYQGHRNQNGFSPLAAGIFGFAAGALATGIANSSRNSHVTACSNTYRSYDVRSDTYLGYDGHRHRCML